MIVPYLRAMARRVSCPTRLFVPTTAESRSLRFAESFFSLDGINTSLRRVPVESVAMYRGDNLRRASFIVAPTSRRLGDPALNRGGYFPLALRLSLLPRAERRTRRAVGASALDDPHPDLHGGE